MKDKGLRYSASNPKLNNKIYSKVDPNKDTVYWYIKFNIPLDPNSVNENNMYVTDVGGYVMQTFIEYSPENTLISISPIDSYNQNTYYILTVTTNVRSSKGNKLPREVHIVFKLVQDRISEYEVMKKEVEVPAPKKRPKNYDISKVKSKVKGYNKDLNVHLKGNNLSGNAEKPLEKLKIHVNYIPAIISYILVIISIFFNNFIILLVFLLLAVIASVYVLASINKSDNKSAIYYNIGVNQFNKENYGSAKINFRKAQILNSKNKLIEYANIKIDFYID